MKYEVPLNIVIEPMTVEDLDPVTAIERECGLSSYGVEKYLQLLAEPKALMLVAVEPLRENSKRLISGLFSSSLVLDELQLDNVAVTPRSRRLGIASRLVTEGLSRAERRGARKAVLEVRSANLPARLLYERHGFIVRGRRRDYYHDPLDDALIMTREL